MDPRRLRQETREEHEATEAMLPLTSQSLTREGYIAALQRLDLLIRSWEGWALAAAPAPLRGLVTKHRRAHLLEKDLQAMAAPSLPELRAVDWDHVVDPDGAGKTGPAFTARFAGALYVIEGSSLGGRFISRHVQPLLGLLPGEGNAYFEGYGDQTGTLWREVAAVIEVVPDELADEVIGAARRAFRAFGQGLGTDLDASAMVHSEHV